MKRVILLVEDEPSIADNIQYALKAEGFKIHWFSQGIEAKAYLERNPVDLILLDVGLPDINGFDLCRDIRKAHRTPIIFLTARSDEIDRVVGLEIGADDYLAKPFSLRELSARVRAVLRRCQPDEAPVVPSSKKIGPFTVDESRSTIHYFGEPLSLSRYEYRLLKVFLDRPGRLLSRAQIMDLAWEEPETSLERTVDAHIKSIRAKLRAIHPEEDPIQTHRGMGYAFKDQ